jgi:hypothetical protein
MDKKKKLGRFSVTVYVSGSTDVEVDAESEKEAKELAVDSVIEDRYFTRHEIEYDAGDVERIDDRTEEEAAEDEASSRIISIEEPNAFMKDENIDNFLAKQKTND